MPAAWTGWYLDPKDEKAFGPNAKNYKYDLAEAKKMVEAAGLKSPLDISRSTLSQAHGIPASFYKRAEIFLGMIENSGVFKMKRDLITYQDWNTEKVRFSGGKFNGASWGPDTATGDPTANAFFLYNSKGGYYQGGDAKMDELTNKARAEFDDAKRKDSYTRPALQRRPLLEQQDRYCWQLRLAVADRRRPAAKHLPRRDQLDGPPRLHRPDAASEEGVNGIVATAAKRPRGNSGPFFMQTFTNRPRRPYRSR